MLYVYGICPCTRSLTAVAFPGGNAEHDHWMKVTGALSVGALIKGDMRAGDEYRLALEAHLSGIPSNTEPRAAPALSLMALYWQHLGDDDLKLHWLGYVRGALGNGQVRVGLDVGVGVGVGASPLCSIPCRFVFLRSLSHTPYSCAPGSLYSSFC